VATRLLNLRLDEVAVPGLPAGRCPLRERGRVSTADNALGEGWSEAIRNPGAEAPAKQRLDEARPLSEELALGERMQPQDAHAAGERVGELGHEQDIRGTRQDEPSGGPVTVDGNLERGEDLGNSLDLVKDRSWTQPFHESDGIESGRTLDRLVVERHVAVTARLADEASQRGLAALARPVNQDGRRVGERLAQARGEVAWERDDF
jgi:hypothetical protein